MGFLYPLFLIAGIALAIPLLIHLFNLRRFKKMDFPSLRFLRLHTIQNKKMSQLQKKLLLTARLLCLAFLILAFAQPIWNSSKTGAGSRHAWVLYIDNSMSMDAQQGQQRLLDVAKNMAADWLAQSEITEIIVLSNDAMYNPKSLIKTEALQAIRNIEPVANEVNPESLVQALSAIKEQLFYSEVTGVVFSDMHANIWATTQPISLEENLELLLAPVAFEAPIYNTYVDTVYFLEQPSDPSIPVPLVTEIRSTGGTHQLDFQVQVDQQARSTRQILVSPTDTLITDTTMISLPSGRWSQIQSGFQSAVLSFDDQYFLTASIPVNDQVLVFNEGSANAYLTSAFAARRGILPLQKNLTTPLDIPNNALALIAFQGMTKLSIDQGQSIRKLLEEGHSVLMVFGKNASLSALNEGLKEIGPIQIVGIDTQMQQTVDLQVGHPLIRDVLQHTAENLQLPYSRYGYKIKAGITAGGQDLLRYRDGAPFVSQYQIGTGKLYLIASPLDASAGNLHTSYLFAPILHKMTVNGGNTSVYTAEVGQLQPIFVPSSGQKTAAEPVTMHKGEHKMVPRQKPRGMGTEVFLPDQIKEAGFYNVENPTGEDIMVGINFNRKESDIKAATEEQMLEKFSNKNVRFFKNPQSLASYGQSGSSFPLWKIAVFIALCMFVFETYLLASPPKKAQAKA